ncbi:MAG: hypothetical protein KDB79_03350, partial [Acidobacteria bacterium]|nr:hypothetical protein [Acidobacteriota bacterium]
SDIYSLGVMLFELLSGHRPYDLEGKPLHEISRLVCEAEPQLPSEIIGKNRNLLPRYAGEIEAVSESRGSKLGELKDVIRGSLDRIIMKAIAKDPARRYGSVKDLSGDIERFLEGREVKAEAYRSAKKPRHETEAAKPNTKSIAVLPFRTLNLLTTEDTGDKFFGLGLADALIARLSKIRRFVVRPTSSILAFEEQSVDLVKAARDLQVDYVLDGNIKRAADRMRISVQLLDVRKNAAIWATSIDETIGDFFSLEDAISKKVIEALLPQLTGNDLEEFSKRGTNNAEAYEHYLRGRYYFSSTTEEGFARAFVSFHRAIAEDPGFAHAYIGLADYYCFLGIYGVLPPQECFQSAIQMAQKAVELDGELADAHASLGFSLHGGNYDWSKAEYHLSRSLELNPNSATAYVWFAIVRYTEGRFSEGLNFAKRAIELDPLTPFNHHNLGWGLYFARRFEESSEQYKKLTSDFPEYGLGYYGLAKNLRRLGKISEAYRATENIMKTLGDSNFVKLSVAETYAADGKREKAEEILGEVSALSEDRFVSPYLTALVYAQMGDKQNTLESLKKAVEIKDAWLNWFAVEPAFDLIREDEYFQTVLEFTGYDIFPKSSIAVSADAETPELHNLPTLVLGDESPDSAGSDSFPGSRKIWQNPWIYLASVLLALVAFLGFYKSGSDNGSATEVGTPALRSQSIVILPFESDGLEDENLGIGLADALSNRLGYIRRLSVIAPNSGRSVKDKTIAEIGTELNVGYILRGSLARKSANVNVNVELLDPKNEKPLWKENFTAADGDLFEIQTKIAGKIWNSLGIEPLPMERRQIAKVYTTNRAAYDLYLIGRYQLTDRSPENLHKAIGTFTKAVEADKDFALAYAGLADSYALLKLYDIPPPADAFDMAEKFALKAISIDENLVEAHTSLAYIKFYGQRNFEGAELEFRRAIQLNPSYSQAHHWFGLLLISLNRPVDAIGEIETATKLDPNSLIVRTALAKAYFHNKQFKQSIAECEKVLADQKDFVPAYKIMRWAYLMQNNYQAAKTAFQNELSFSGGDIDDPGWYMIVAQVESLTDKKKEIAEKLDAAVRQPVVKDSPDTFSYEIALAYAGLGEKQKSLDWLEKAESSGDSGIVQLESDPRLEKLRKEPRFRELLRKIKKTE